MSIPTDEHQKRVAELQELLEKREASDNKGLPPPTGFYGHPPPTWRMPS
jgi:hypothetical protein